MRHFRQISGPRFFTDDVTIQFEGSPKCGASFDVEVEFQAWPDSYDASVGQGDAGEREIIAVRPYEYKRRNIGGDVWVNTTERVYPDCPPWLSDYLRDCVDVDSLEADFSDE